MSNACSVDYSSICYIVNDVTKWWVLVGWGGGGWVFLIKGPQSNVATEPEQDLFSDNAYSIFLSSQKDMKNQIEFV